MSVRAHGPVEFRNPEAKCSFCGSDEWTGEWMGHVAIYVCPRCAEETLPRLLADAVWRYGAAGVAQVAWMKGILDRVRAEFWRAIAINAARDQRPITHVLDTEKDSVF